MTDDAQPVRIGILGAARIAPAGVVKPARANPEAEVVAVASRDAERARRFAEKHRVPKVHANYDELLLDDQIDAVYNPLPNGLHARWTIAALEAGKHVLCEKPFTSNAAEGESVAATAERTGRVVMEAFHYRYHPLAQRMLEIVESGELGAVQHIDTALCFPLPMFSDIRYQYELAGGATMDVGAYTVHMARLLGREEPKVAGARPKLRNRDVDRAMTADLQFPSGHTARLTHSMWPSNVLRAHARVTGDLGEMPVLNPTSPQLWHRLHVRSEAGARNERFFRRPTYEYQLDAFCAAVLRGEPTLTPPSDSIANMRVIDDIYAAAGMRLRGLT